MAESKENGQNGSHKEEVKLPGGLGPAGTGIIRTGMCLYVSKLYSINNKLDYLVYHGH